MLRFIANFILFGILFYLISVYFPEPFKTLVSWADGIVHFVKDTFHVVMDKVGTMGHPNPS